MKICKICNIEKQYDMFHNFSREPDGKHKVCKECRKKETLEYYHKNKDSLSKKRSETYYKNHEENLKKDRIRIQNEREKRRKNSSEYLKNNKEKVRQYKKEYYKKNKEKIINKVKVWYLNNKEKSRKSSNLRNNKRKKTDALYKLKCLLKTNFYISLKKYKKSKKIEDILGISISEFKIYLEQQFSEGMTWENHSKQGWHIDHIVPISSAKTEEELYLLWHYTNLRPLWAKENLKKSNKILN